MCSSDLRNIPQSLDGREHVPLRLRAYLASFVQNIGNGRGRNTRGRCDVANGDIHWAQSTPSCTLTRGIAQNIRAQFVECSTIQKKILTMISEA